MAKQASCEERIEERLDLYIIEAMLINMDLGALDGQERAHALANLCKHLMDEGYDASDLGGKKPYELQELARWAFSESALGRDHLYTVYRIQFSWGGPSDHFEVFCDREGDVEKVEYVFLDWFDGARRRVRDDDLIELLTQEVEWIRECEVANGALGS